MSIKKNILWISIIFIIIIISIPFFWGLRGFLEPEHFKHDYEKYKDKPSEFLISKLNSVYIYDLDVVTKILIERKEKKAVEPYIKLLNSKIRYKRQTAMRALTKIGDKRAIEPLKDIVKKGRSHPDYLMAMKTLSFLHCEDIYPEILQMARDNFHTSWVVGMLENFSDKLETSVTLQKIAETDPEGYIRNKAKRILIKLGENNTKDGSSANRRSVP